MSDPGFTIELAVGLERTPRAFSAIDELREWLTTEGDAWGWLRNTRNQGGEYVELADKYNNFIAAMEQHLQRFESALSNNQKEAASKAEQELAGHVGNFNSAGLFYSYMPEGQFLHKLAEGSPFAAAYAMRHLLGRASNMSQAAAVEGAVRAILFRLGIKQGAESEAAALKKVAQDSETRLGEFLTNTAKAIGNFEANSAKVIEDAERERRNYGEIIDAKEKDFNALIDEGRARITNIEHTYDKKLALQKSVEYWKQRKRRHWAAAAVAAIVAVGGGIGLAIYIHGLVNMALAGIESIAHQPWKYGFVLVVLGLGIWALRLCVRMYLSNVHSATDAGERETMVLTYLALLREGSALSENDKSVIFAALFRPSQFVLPSDDAAPVSSGGLLSRMFSGR